MPGHKRGFGAVASFLACWLACAAPGAIAAPPPVEGAPAEQPEPRPALWLLADSDTRIYLFGTFHILPPGFRWRSAAIDAVIDEADELVLEIADAELEVVTPEVIGLTMLGKTAPLAWRVSPDRRPALKAMLAESGLPAEVLDSMQTWAAALTVAVAALIRSYGGDAEAPLSAADMEGVEIVLRREFVRTERPISGVETGVQQLGFIAGQSFADQRRMLEDMVDGRAGGDTIQDVSERDWVQGNIEGLVLNRDQIPGTLYETLIVHRNAAWTEWLRQRLERPGTVLFAVGAGHLAGPDSVQSMLAARGLTIRRLDR